MILGIDLGTTNSLVAVFRDGQPVLIPNALGHLLTPSAVSLDDGDQVLVGLAARERRSTYPERTATAFKRWMGTSHRVRLGRREFTPEELSALVLGSLKRDAEHFLGEPVDRAIITVPAYFNEAQRRATRTAGELAGLKVEGLLNEPTAAGLAYGLQSRPDHTRFLVFDLGGGTFDVSILEYFEGVVQVRASAGDTQLGGEDFVRALTGMLLEHCASDEERERVRHSDSWWHQVESLKRQLSDSEQAEVVLPEMAPVLVTREGFERAAQPLLDRLRKPLERALSDARLRAIDLDEIVLVGGATRMPMVRQMVTRLFQRLPLRVINPDETIARGAAIQAGLKARDAALDDVVLTDVMPYSLGIATTAREGEVVMHDVFAPIIERNQPVPISRSQVFATVEDNQTRILVKIYQGESPLASENLALGELEVRVPALPKYEATIDVRFSYDTNGLLEVDVTSVRSGTRAATTIVQTPGMSAEQIAQAKARLAGLKIHPRDLERNRQLIERAKRLYAHHLGPERERIQAALNAFHAALERQDTDDIERRRSALRTLLDSVDQNDWL